MKKLSDISGYFKRFGISESTLCEWLGISHPGLFTDDDYEKCRQWYAEYNEKSKVRNKNLQTIRLIRESLNLKHGRR